MNFESKLRKFCIVAVFCSLLLMLFSTIQGYIELSEMNEQLVTLAEDSLKECETAIDNYRKMKEMYDEVVAENAELKVSEKPVYKYTEDEIYLLAQCVEAEAGYNKQCQKYVTQVILNRVYNSQFPNTIRKVIYQKVKGVEQFSVAYNGRMKREVKPETLLNVYSVLMHGTDLPEYVLYFYEKSVTDNWVNTLNIYDQYGDNIFAYSDRDKERAK